jgi:hypothetical protein
VQEQYHWQVVATGNAHRQIAGVEAVVWGSDNFSMKTELKNSELVIIPGTGANFFECIIEINYEDLIKNCRFCFLNSGY